jgi:hypothetical protein
VGCRAVPIAIRRYELDRRRGPGSGSSTHARRSMSSTSLQNAAYLGKR